MSRSDDSRLYWFALQTVPNIGTLRYTVLVKRFGSPQVALEASTAELKRIPDFGEKVVEALKTQVDWVDAEKQLATLDKTAGGDVGVGDVPVRLVRETTRCHIGQTNPVGAATAAGTQVAHDNLADTR